MNKIFIPRSFSLTGMLFALIITCCTNISLAQDYKKIDSLHKKLASTTNDTSRVWALHDLAIIYLYSNNDSSAWFAQQAMMLSKKINYTRGEIRSMNDIGNALSITGSYSSAIEIFLSALEKSENLKDERMKATSLGNLAEVYNEQGDFKQAIRYTMGSLTIDVANHDTPYTIIDYLNLSDYYVKVNMPDSALPYATQAYQLALKVNAIEQMPSIQMNLGNIHSALGDDDIALPYFRKSIVNALSIANYNILSRSYYSMACLFSRAGRLDSSFYYNRKSYEIATKASDRKNMLLAATMLASFFEKTNNDSTLKYLKITIALKDSLFNQEKTKQVQSLTINEQLRQQEIESAKKIAAEERHQNIQYALIGIGIISFIILFLLLSRRLITNTKVIEFFGVLALLFVFEFLNLFLHPYLERLTNHSTLVMLLALVCIASLLIPAHHTLEKWATKKLVEKNKAIRLAAAKKTIQKLDTAPNNL